MHESSHCDCGCCADAHFGALLNQTSRLIRRALDARINAEVSSELSGVRGMVLGDIVRAERQGRVYRLKGYQVPEGSRKIGRAHV